MHNPIHVILDDKRIFIERHLGLKKNPYLIVNRSFVWDEGTDQARALPTIEMVWVPPARQGKGLGGQLVNHLLQVMRSQDIPFVVFDNFADKFWLSMKKAHSGQVDFMRLGSKTRALGLLKADPGLPWTARMVFRGEHRPVLPAGATASKRSKP